MSWEKVKITEICRPKQWKTLPTNVLLSDGYCVYGANGIIGYYNDYTHEEPTLAITCRGATCGTVHITQPKSYINGNAMALDNLSPKVDRKYLFYYFKSRGFADVISGSAQPQITGEGLNKVEIPLPALPIQKRIAEILDAADALRRKDQELLKKYDELAQAIFIDMFGDPVKNEKGWEVKKLGEFALVDAKAVDPEILSEYNYIGLEHIEKETGKILKTDNGTVVSNKFLFTNEHILYGKLRPYLNKVAIPDFDGICSTDIYPIKPKNRIYKYYLTSILRSKNFVNYANTNAVGANLPRVNKDVILSYETIVPNEAIIERYTKLINSIDQNKERLEKNILYGDVLFDSLLQKAFKGELVKEEELV